MFCPISRTLASVCLSVYLCLFWFFFFQLLYFNSSAAQEHKCAPKQGWQHKSQNARRAKYKIPPPSSCSSPCLLYFDFYSFLPHCPLSSIFFGTSRVSSLFLFVPYLQSCARYSGWIPKTCNYAQFRPSNRGDRPRLPDQYLR